MALSRFTDPGRFAAMLAELPADPRAIASLARVQTIHHNLLPHLGVGPDLWSSLPRVSPPRLGARLLWDFASVLNHDGAGLDQLNGRDYAFIKRQKYDETVPAELAALDALASLLAAERFEQLAEFYWATPAVRLEAAERDPHSLVFKATRDGWV